MHGNLERGSLLRLGFTLLLSLLWTTPVIDQRQSSRHAEDKMEIIRGTIRETIPAIDGKMCGFVMDGGMEVHFSPEKAAQVSPLISVGSRVEICGKSYRGISGDPRLDAQFITNLDSDRFVNLETPPPLHHPEVSTSNCPTAVEAAPLAPPASARVEDGDNSMPQGSTYVKSAEQARHTPILSAKFLSHTAFDGSLVNRSRRSRANEDRAAKSIELAYDGVHRSQALLAYVKIVDLQAPDVSQLFEEAMHTYQQAVSNYEKQDFEVASEFATASGELSRCVELVVSRILRSDSGYPRLVPYPLHKSRTLRGLRKLKIILHGSKSYWPAFIGLYRTAPCLRKTADKCRRLLRGATSFTPRPESACRREPWPRRLISSMPPRLLLILRNMCASRTTSHMFRRWTERCSGWLLIGLSRRVKVFRVTISENGSLLCQKCHYRD